MRKYFAIMALGVLCACAPHRTPDTNFYTLVPMNGDVKYISLDTPSIDVDRVKVAEYIDRPQIITTSGVKVNVAQYDRWAEGLPTMLQRQIISDIGTYLPNASVKNATFMGAGADYTVFIEISKLDGNLGDNVEIEAVYSISDTNGHTPITHFVKDSVTVGDEYSDYVEKIGDMVHKLSRRISQDIVNLEKR